VSRTGKQLGKGKRSRHSMNFSEKRKERKREGAQPLSVQLELLGEKKGGWASALSFHQKSTEEKRETISLVLFTMKGKKKKNKREEGGGR